MNQTQRDARRGNRNRPLKNRRHYDPARAEALRAASDLVLGYSEAEWGEHDRALRVAESVPGRVAGDLFDGVVRKPAALVETSNRDILLQEIHIRPMASLQASCPWCLAVSRVTAAGEAELLPGCAHATAVGAIGDEPALHFLFEDLDHLVPLVPGVRASMAPGDTLTIHRPEAELAKAA